MYNEYPKPEPVHEIQIRNGLLNLKGICRKRRLD